MPIAAPAYLPRPSAVRISQPDLRAKSRDGNIQVRLRSGEEVLKYTLTYDMKYAHASAFASWWVADLAKGQRVASITLPGPGGFLARSVRFTSPPKLSAPAFDRVEVQIEAESA